MDGNHLSNRLSKVAEYVPINARMADIGSDHAYLPVYLANNRLISYAVAGEVVKGPFENAKHEIVKEGLEEIIQPRLADGLAAIESTDEIDTVVIAGMGGALITSILTEGRHKLDNVKRLILQPNIGEDNIRKWVQENGYQISAEAILAEDGHSYEIIVADATTAVVEYQPKELLFGPYLVKERNQAFINKWRLELLRLKEVEAQIKSATTSPVEKLEQVELKIKAIEEVLG